MAHGRPVTTVRRTATTTAPTSVAAVTTIAVLLMILTACSGPSTTPPESTPAMITAPPPPYTESPEPTMSAMPLPPGAPTTAPEGILDRESVRAAVADFAERQGVATEDVEVVGHAEVTWPDGSVGCPRPRMAYTQALVPGEQLIVRSQGIVGSYHAARGGGFSYCPFPSAPVSGEAGH